MNDYVISSYNDRHTKIYVHDFPETVSDYIRNTQNFFEIYLLHFIKNNYPQQNEILDIGANIGNHTLFFAEFLDCKKIHSFEPVPINLKVLKKNIEKYGDKCICYDVALSDHSGHSPLYNSQKENYGGFSLHSYSNGVSFLVGEEIKVKTLDSFEFNNITMIKIDVENHEIEVLEGARDTLLRNKPIIFIENLHPGYPHICPDPEPHQKILHSLNYTKKCSNIHGSLIDLWVPSITETS